MRKAHIRRSRRAPTEVETIRTSLVELRRLFQRKELTALWTVEAGSVPPPDYGDLRLLDAIAVAQARRGSASVGDASRLLGVDPSRASRQVARAVAAGLLRRRAAQDDGRKVVLEVTARGARLQAQGSELTRARIALAIEGWPDADRVRLAQLFTRFVAAIVA